MPLDELSDDQLDRKLRELLPPAPRSRSWERAQREALIHYITTGETSVPVEAEPHGGEPVGELFELTDRPAPSRRRRWLVPTSAAAAAVALIGGLVLAQQRSAGVPAPAQAPVTSLAAPPTGVADAVPSLPTGAVEPDRFGVVGDTWPDAGTSTAQWGTPLGSDATTAEALVARSDDGTLRDGIALTVRPSAQLDATVGEPEQRAVAGLAVEVFTEPGTPSITTVVLPGAPALAVSGRDPIAFLEAAGGFPIEGARIDDGGNATFAIGGLPNGYETIIEPTRRANGTIDAWTRASDGDGGDGIAVVVGVNDPRLAWAQVGDLEELDIDSTIGWLVDQNGVASLHWQASDTTWASIIGASDVDDAVQFARSIELVDQDTWAERYDVEPSDPSTLTPSESPAPAPASTIADR